MSMIGLAPRVRMNRNGEIGVDIRCAFVYLARNDNPL